MQKAARTIIALLAATAVWNSLPSAATVDAPSAPLISESGAPEQAGSEPEAPAQASSEPEAGRLIAEPQASSIETEVAQDAPGIYNASPETTNVISRSQDRFAETGLELPALRIYVHENKEGCQGYEGLFSRHEGGRIDFCTDDATIILHELAHAWEHHELTDEDRKAFLESRGLTELDSLDVERHERGIELAANIVAFGLRRDPLTQRKVDLFGHMLEGFEFLTGFEAPRMVAG